MSYRGRRGGTLRAATGPADRLLLAAVVLLPWAFGGVELWAYRTAAALIAVAAVLAYREDGPGALALDREGRWLAPAVLLAVWATVQLVPLPAPVVATLSPTAAAIHAETYPDLAGVEAPSAREGIEKLALRDVPEADGVPDPRPESNPLPAGEPGGRWSGWRPLSLLPSMGAERVGWYAALLLAFVLVWRRCRERDVAPAYRTVLLGNFLALAVFGLVNGATSNGKLYWVRGTVEGARPFGPYVNPTNFAGVMELATPWIAGAAAIAWRRRRGGGSRDRRLPLLLAAGSLCLLATLATANKSSPVLQLAALTAIGLLAARSWRGRVIVAGALAVVLALGVAVVPHTRLGERIDAFLGITAEGYSDVDRLVTAEASLGMLRDYPVTGVGYGAFRDVFPLYMPPGGQSRWSQLHDDWLEATLEGGAVGALLLLWLVAAYWRRVARPRAMRSSRGVDLEQLGVVLGLALLSVHAFFDFNHQIPANALLFVAIAGYALARAERRADGRPERPARRSTGRPSPAVLALAGLVAAAFVAWGVIGWIAGPAWSRGRRLAANGNYAAAVAPLERAAWGSQRPVALWLLGQVRLGLWQQRLLTGEGVERPAELLEPAYRETAAALSMSPASGWYRAALGDVYAQVERYERYELGTPLEAVSFGPWGTVGRPGRVAIGLTRAAIEREPMVYTFHDQLAFRLLDHGLREEALAAVRRSAEVHPVFRFHAYDNLAPPPDELVDAFAEASRGALGQVPFVPEVIHRIALARIELRRGRVEQAERDARAAIAAPGHALNRADAHYVLGLALERQGRPDEAEAAYAVAGEHPNFAAAALAARARLAEDRGRLDEALELLRQARRMEPRRTGWIVDFARIAVDLGRYDEAEQALHWLRTIQPGRPEPLARLGRLYLAAGRAIDAGSIVTDLRAMPGGQAEADALEAAVRGRPAEPAEPAEAPE